MKHSVDMEIFKDARLSLAVEVKRKTGADERWATALYKNLISMVNDIVNSKFFLIAVPDRFFLWKDPALHVEREHPDYTGLSLNSQPLGCPVGVVVP